MPIGKYIYCTRYKIGLWGDEQESQMPIGKYIYCTRRLLIWRRNSKNCHKCLSASTFTVPGRSTGITPTSPSHKCLSASTFTVHAKSRRGWDLRVLVTNAYRQVHLLYRLRRSPSYSPRKRVTNAYRQVHLLYQ